MKVILAGYSKTGTKSISKALTMLGYNTYDFFEHYWFHGNDWLKILKHGGTTKDFYEMYKDVDAVVDAPAFFFWEEIHKAHPDAKIVLSIREEDRWLNSFVRQTAINCSFDGVRLAYMIASTQLNPYKLVAEFLPYMFAMYRVVFGTVVGDKHTNEMVSRMLYRRHNAYVLKTAPKEKLLVFSVSDGWQPLCEFLGKDVPDAPFPHQNKNSAAAEEILAENPIAKANLKVAKRRCSWIFLFLLVSILVAVFLAIF